MFDINQLFLVTGLLILVSILSSKVSERFGMPALLLFMAIGIVAGSDVSGWIDFDNADVANYIGTIALAYILFSGGLDTSWQSIRPVLGRGILLATLGVAMTATLLGFFTWWVLDLSLLDSLLLAAIVSSTDAAAVFAVLRSRSVSLKGNLRPLLELESGSNDPMAIFLTTALLAIWNPDESASWIQMVPKFLLQMSVGTVVGLVTGKLTAVLCKRVRLDYEGLYPVLSMSVVVLVFGLSEVLQGNGFLAAYLCGIVLGNHDFMEKRSLIRFHDGMSWLMQIGLFLILGLLVFPRQLPTVIGSGLLVSGFLMFVARPLAIYAGLWRSAFDMRERTLVAWTGLRGAVPIVLATFPMVAGHPQSELIFNIVFFVVITSLLLQGKSLMMVARWLGVDEPLDLRPRYPLQFDRPENMHGETREFDIEPGAAVAGKSIQELGLPADVLVLLIRRGGAFVVPRGPTRLLPHDTLMVLAEPEPLGVARRLLTAKATPEEAGPPLQDGEEEEAEEAATEG